VYETTGTASLYICTVRLSYDNVHCLCVCAGTTFSRYIRTLSYHTVEGIPGTRYLVGTGTKVRYWCLYEYYCRLLCSYCTKKTIPGRNTQKALFYRKQPLPIEGYCTRLQQIFRYIFTTYSYRTGRTCTYLSVCTTCSVLHVLVLCTVKMHRK
jgi:hypothetical protein